jgi:hypothetical protein
MGMNRAEQRAAWRARHRYGSPARPVPAAASPVPDINFEIGEIALHGLPRLNRLDLAEGVHAELTRSLQADGLPPHFRGLDRVNRVDGGRIAIEPAARPASVGRQIAGAILRGPAR